MLLQKIEKIIDKTAYILDKIAGLALLFLVILFCANIILRAVWQPIVFAYDLSGLVATIVVAFSVAYCSVQGGHIRVDLLFNKFPKTVAAVIKFCYDTLAFLTMTFCSYAMVRYAINCYQKSSVSATNRIPYFPFAVCVAIGLIVLTIVILLKLIVTISKMGKNNAAESEEGDEQ